MKNFSNTYIFIFSAVMVILVAALLAIVAQSLKPRQDLNVKVEKMQNILASVQIESTTKNAEELYNKFVAESYVVNFEGEKLEAITAFDVDLKKEVAKIDVIKKFESLIQERRISPFKSFLGGFIRLKEIDKSKVTKQIKEVKETRQLPMYICSKEGKQYYIFPLRGKGLWGPIWGYVALEEDLNTIYGAVFDHKTETPGLGAEIKESSFENNFIGKTVFKDGEFNSIEVAKGGALPDDSYAVDAISGGTITSKGVEDMIFDCMKSYLIFIEKQRN